MELEVHLKALILEEWVICNKNYGAGSSIWPAPTKKIHVGGVKLYVSTTYFSNWLLFV